MKALFRTALFALAALCLLADEHTTSTSPRLRDPPILGDVPGRPPTYLDGDAWTASAAAFRTAGSHITPATTVPARSPPNSPNSEP